MKYNLLLLLLVITFYANCSADCICPQEEIRFIPCPKTYVNPDQIDIHDNAIFVQIHDMILQTESLGTDAQGVFFFNVREKECGPSQWKCTRLLPEGIPCDTCNWTWNNWCNGCGREKKR